MITDLLRTLWAALMHLMPWAAVFSLGTLFGVSLSALCTASGQADAAALILEKRQACGTE